MTTPPLQTDRSAHRHRLLAGMARAVTVRGYTEITIADVVREAGVSRRTFYEHFASKAECLIALYEAASHNALDVLREGIDTRTDWEGQVEKAMTAYLDHLAQNPMLLRTLFVEILGLGAPGLAARRRVTEQFAKFMLDVVNGQRGRRRQSQRLSEDLAMAVVGGINELVLRAIERDRIGRLREVTVPALALLRAGTTTGT